MKPKFHYNPTQNRRGYVISILVDDRSSWILPWAEQLSGMLGKYHHTTLVFEAQNLVEGNMAFLLGCTRILPKAALAKNRLNLIVHESALPDGRGWSPVAWQVLEGKKEIPVVLFDARPGLDSGPIYLRSTITLDGTELLPEIKFKQGVKTVEMVCEFLEKWPDLQCEEQTGTPTYYPRRTVENDCLDVRKTLAEQFDQLRIVNNQKYPAWFVFRNRKYRLEIYPYDEVHTRK